jgi:hypothetical protein
VTTDRCGTALGYRDHVVNRTPKCTPCRVANAARRQEYRRRRYLNRGPFKVSAVGTQRRLQALAAIGWSSRVVAGRLGVTPQTLRRLHEQVHVWTTTRDRVAAVYDELSMTPGGCRRAQTWAVKRGWLPPLSWNDEEMDDPAATPMGVRTGNEPSRMNRDTDLQERVLVLTRAGLSAAEISVRLGTNPRYVQRVRARARQESAA